MTAENDHIYIYIYRKIIVGGGLGVCDPLRMRDFESDSLYLVSRGERISSGRTDPKVVGAGRPPWSSV